MQAKCKTSLFHGAILHRISRKLSTVRTSSRTLVGNTLNIDTTENDTVPIQFDDYKTIFKNKDLSELSRALLVLRICSFDWVVNNGEKVIMFV